MRIDELVPRRRARRHASPGRLPEGAATVALDERGELATSEALAARLGDWRDAGRDLAFLIGGADGLDAAMRACADWRLAPGRLAPGRTSSVCLLLVEQLYRASTILAGHPYHRGERCPTGATFTSAVPMHRSGEASSSPRRNRRSSPPRL
ncbi:MAG: 23S rRNA (pseudouridine(1915)-N(3))-methyltransferase RlmH [Geminicoccaceae bacterium]